MSVRLNECPRALHAHIIAKSTRRVAHLVGWEALWRQGVEELYRVEALCSVVGLVSAVAGVRLKARGRQVGRQSTCGGN